MPANTAEFDELKKVIDSGSKHDLLAYIDGLPEHSPAEHVRRPRVPAESPTLGLTHLQFEALLTAARTSSNRNDFALIACLVCSG